MSDNDKIICCILGICCAPGSDEQRDALAVFLSDGSGTPIDAARPYADAILKRFELIPHGSLKEFRALAHRAARRNEAAGA